MRNAISESFLIHFRCIYGFLYNEKPRMNDVIVSNFDTKDKFAPSDALSQFNKFADKSLAHLTADRLENKSAFSLDNFPVAYNQIRCDIIVFLNGLDSEYQKLEEILGIKALLDVPHTNLPIPESAPT